MDYSSRHNYKRSHFDPIAVGNKHNTKNTKILNDSTMGLKYNL